MAGHQIPERKISILRKRVRNLSTAIAQFRGIADLTKAAEAVRHAQLQMLRSRLYHMEPATSEEESDELDRLRRKIDSDIEMWTEITSSPHISQVSNIGLFYEADCG